MVDAFDEIKLGVRCSDFVEMGVVREVEEQVSIGRVR